MSSTSILEAYASSPAGFDEVVQADGSIRPSCADLWNKLATIPREELQKRDQLLKSLIADNGITYNVYSDEENNRQWSMDLLPIMFSESDWSVLEDKLVQRAELSNEILKDLYTNQHALLDAQLPPYLVYANPSFLRPCYGINPLGGEYVNLYSADIVRSANGNWWVLSDRVEAASGMGYVLENRMLSNRVFHDFFRDSSISRLQPFYDSFVDSIKSLNPTNEGEQRVGLLTPGPANETYFEQSFLARNLGFELVEGNDLTVRDNQLYYKTLNGKHRIHTLLRRLDSEWCDPLELRNESLLGIPGLVNSIRSGNLGMTNMLGTGLMETVAFPAFLNSLCQYYRNEELKIPSVATWWCGQPSEFQYVIENLKKLVIKKTFRGRYDQAIFGPYLSESNLTKLKTQISQNPENYCAQEIISEATAPVFGTGENIQPHHFLIRVYLARKPNGFKMLPGGLARIAPEPGSSSVSMQHGAMSKDIWILKDHSKPILHLQSQRVDSGVPPEPASIEISSKTANNMFWLGRYIERCEALARLLRLIILSLTEDFHVEKLPQLRSFIAILLDDLELKELDKLTGIEKIDYLENILKKYVWDKNFAPSLTAGFDNIRRIAFNVKDRLSNDTWQILSNIKGISNVKPSLDDALINEFNLRALEESIDWFSTFSGKTAENMTQGLAWNFLLLGKRFERAFTNLEFYQHSAKENPDQHDGHLSLLLDYFDSKISYQNLYLTYFRSDCVWKLILKESKNPRSLQFTLEQIIQHLGALPWRDVALDTDTANIQSLSTQLLEQTSRLQPDKFYIEASEEIMETLQQINALLDQKFFTHV